MYGENAGALREHLSTLLRQHRIQQRIGGAGSHTIPVTTTITEREEIGQLIRRYRHSILRWCHQALDSADLGRSTATRTVELPRRVAQTLDVLASSPASMSDLTTPHRFTLVETWRLGARAAVLGEHDFAGDMARGRLSAEQSLTVVKDAADIAQGLIVLDRRYKNIPGWTHLPSAKTLKRAAEACAFIDARDFTVDRRGWHPSARTIDGPARAGIAGVVQAGHNMLVHLRGFPTALNYRRILHAQRNLSHQLATRLTRAEPDIATRWRDRAGTYAALQRAARDLDGRIGDGSAAATEAANAVSRLRQIPDNAHLSGRALRDLGALFDAVDERLADHFEQGARERLYVVRATVPRIDADDGRVAHRVRERFTPITSPVQTELVHLVNDRLRPPRRPPDPPSDAQASRRQLSEAIMHQPSSRDRGLGH